MSSNKNNDISNPSFWNNLYINNMNVWDLNTPTPIFKNWESTLNLRKKDINICIPGCGTGNDALYFAKKGYNVHAIDFSDIALHYLSESAKINNIKLNIINKDFFKMDKSYHNYFDMILEYTFYCAIDISREKIMSNIVINY